jgi:CheY-like chemotaxis protein
MLELVSRHLRTIEHPRMEVIEASDGDEAWRLACERLPDLVVLDVMMPGMSGWEVCRKIRQDAALAHTGVLMLTGIGVRTSTRPRARSSGPTSTSTSRSTSRAWIRKSSPFCVIAPRSARPFRARSPTREGRASLRLATESEGPQRRLREKPRALQRPHKGPRGRSLNTSKKEPRRRPRKERGSWQRKRRQRKQRRRRRRRRRRARGSS